MNKKEKEATQRQYRWGHVPHTYHAGEGHVSLKSLGQGYNRGVDPHAGTSITEADEDNLK